MPRVASANPAHAVAPKAGGAAPARAPRAAALPRVLCVDDEPAILSMLERALGSQFEVVTSDDPEAALALVEHGRFSVIISDLRMPGMTGTRFLEQAKALSPHSTRLALTAGLDWQLPPDIAFGILTKPCPLPLLTATVSAAAQCHALLTGAPPAHPSDEATPDDGRAELASSALASGAGSASAATHRGGAGGRLASGVPPRVESGLRPRERMPDAPAAPINPPSSRPVAPARLALALLGSVVELWPRATLLGRANDCDIVVRDERVAPRHLRFFSSWRGVTLQDVSGRGNVGVNGEQLVGVRVLAPDDRIDLGPFEIRVKLLDG